MDSLNINIHNFGSHVWTRNDRNGKIKDVFFENHKQQRVLCDSSQKLQIDFTEKGTQGLIMASQKGKLRSKSHTKNETITTQNMKLVH